MLRRIFINIARFPVYPLGNHPAAAIISLIYGDFREKNDKDIIQDVLPLLRVAADFYARGFRKDTEYSIHGDTAEGVFRRFLAKFLLEDTWDSWKWAAMIEPILQPKSKNGLRRPQQHWRLILQK
jgi:hypothetical protein